MYLIWSVIWLLWLMTLIGRQTDSWTYTYLLDLRATQVLLEVKQTDQLTCRRNIKAPKGVKRSANDHSRIVYLAVKKSISEILNWTWQKSDQKIVFSSFHTEFWPTHDRTELHLTDARQAGLLVRNGQIHMKTNSHEFTKKPMNKSRPRRSMIRHWEYVSTFSSLCTFSNVKFGQNL